MHHRRDVKVDGQDGDRALQRLGGLPPNVGQILSLDHVVAGGPRSFHHGRGDHLLARGARNLDCQVQWGTAVPARAERSEDGHDACSWVRARDTTWVTGIW